MFEHGWFSAAPSAITALGRTVPRRAPTASVNVLLSPQVRAGIVLGQAVALPMVGPAVRACPGCRASTSSAAPSRGGRLRGGGMQFMGRLQCQRANVRLTSDNGHSAGAQACSSRSTRSSSRHRSNRSTAAAAAVGNHQQGSGLGAQLAVASSGEHPPIVGALLSHPVPTHPHDPG
jgi:hypothetical protein